MTTLSQARAAALRTLTRIAMSLDEPIVDAEGNPLSAAAVSQARLAALAILRLKPQDLADLEPETQAPHANPSRATSPAPAPQQVHADQPPARTSPLPSSTPPTLTTTPATRPPLDPLALLNTADLPSLATSRGPLIHPHTLAPPAATLLARAGLAPAA